MKRPQFSLRTLLVLVAVASVPMAWAAYQLNWIRQRHEFIDRYDSKIILTDWMLNVKCPWSLKIFSERPRSYLFVEKGRMDEAKRLFPEADVFEDHPNR